MNMHVGKSGPDGRGHHPGCPHYNEQSPTADKGSTHIDLFCDCHKNIEPAVLANGSDVAWPAGWSEQQASQWRRRNGLVRPSEPGSGP